MDETHLLVFESSNFIKPIKSCLRNSDQDSRKSDLTLRPVPCACPAWCAAGFVSNSCENPLSNRSQKLIPIGIAVLELSQLTASAILTQLLFIPTDALSLPLGRFR
jgi:hypothetical protein